MLDCHSITAAKPKQANLAHPASPNLKNEKASQGDFYFWFGSPYAEDGADLCYVKDGARAIALLMLSDRLHHQTYNVATGRPTTNQEVVEAIKSIIPEADF